MAGVKLNTQKLYAWLMLMWYGVIRLKIINFKIYCMNRAALKILSGEGGGGEGGGVQNNHLHIPWGANSQSYI